MTPQTQELRGLDASPGRSVNKVKLTKAKHLDNEKKTKVEQLNEDPETPRTFCPRMI